MIRFVDVTTEFRSLVERRRRQLGFLFSTVAAFAMLTDGLLHGRLPRALALDSGGLVVAGAAALMFVSVVTAIREVRLHVRLVFNGTLFEALAASAGESIDDGGNRPWRFNPFGVSFALFTIAVMVSIGLWGFIAAVVGVKSWLIASSCVVMAGLALILFGSQHRAGGALAVANLRVTPVAGADFAAWRAHISASVDDAHRDMLELLSLAGLVAFSGFLLLAGLGDVRMESLVSLPVKEIQASAPFWLSFYMVGVTGITLVSYMRLRVAVGLFGRALDPSAHPFRALRYDDSFYGLLILVALFSFDALLLLAALLPRMPIRDRGALAAGAGLLIVVGELVVMKHVGRAMVRAEN